MTDYNIYELKRKIDILWKLANICPKCNTQQLSDSGCACYPPIFVCPTCGRVQQPDPPKPTCNFNNTNVDDASRIITPHLFTNKQKECDQVNLHDFFQNA